MTLSSRDPHLGQRIVWKLQLPYHSLWCQCFFDCLYDLARLSEKAMRGCERASKAPAKPSKSCYRISGAVRLESEASSIAFKEARESSFIDATYGARAPPPAPCARPSRAARPSPLA